MRFGVKGSCHHPSWKKRPSPNDAREFLSPSLKPGPRSNWEARVGFGEFNIFTHDVTEDGLPTLAPPKISISPNSCWTVPLYWTEAIRSKYADVILLPLNLKSPIRTCLVTTMPKGSCLRKVPTIYLGLPNSTSRDQFCWGQGAGCLQQFQEAF